MVREANTFPAKSPLSSSARRSPIRSFATPAHPPAQPASAKRQRGATTWTAQSASSTSAAGAADPDAAEAQRKREREERAQAKAHVETYNDDLGAAVVKPRSSFKVDATVIQILAAIDLHSDVRKIATRGARYGFPGWVTEESRKNNTLKRVYVEPREAYAKAIEYLEGATSANEIAGRLTALAVIGGLRRREGGRRLGQGVPRRPPLRRRRLPAVVAQRREVARANRRKQAPRAPARPAATRALSPTVAKLSAPSASAKPKPPKSNCERNCRR